MRVTPHSTLAISTCALALLSQLPSVHSAFGGVFQKDRVIKPTVSTEYVMQRQGELGLSNIHWGGGDDKELSFARVVWNNQDAFMKCDKASNEINAFNALDIMKTELKEGRLSKDYAVGQQNVMEPLHRFGFTRNGPVDINSADPKQLYVCHLYSFIGGELLKEYISKNSPRQVYITAFQIFPDIVRGLIYLFNAGIIYHDSLLHNIMLRPGSNGKLTAKIIDLDRTEVFANERHRQKINPAGLEYSLPDPGRQYVQCDNLKVTIKIFLLTFVPQGSVPFVNEDDARSKSNEYLKYFEAVLNYHGIVRTPSSSTSPFDTRLFISAMIKLVYSYNTLNTDPYACSSPIRALKGLEPRIGTPSRPNSPIA